MESARSALLTRHFSRLVAIVVFAALSAAALHGLLWPETRERLANISVTITSYEQNVQAGYLRLSAMQYPNRTFLVEGLRSVDLNVFTLTEKNGSNLQIQIDPEELTGEGKEVRVHGMTGAKNVYLAPEDISDRIKKNWYMNLTGLLGGAALTLWLLLSSIGLFRKIKERGPSGDYDALLVFLIGRPGTILLAVTGTVLLALAGKHLEWQALGIAAGTGAVLSLAARLLVPRLAWVRDIQSAIAAEMERRKNRTQAEVPRELQAVERLLKSPGGIDTENEQGRTALHVAALAGKMEAVEILLRHGASINHADKEGKTALILACEKCMHLGVVTKLLERGADAKLADRSGKTALDYAKDKQKEAFIQVLKGAKAQVPPLLKAAATGNLAEVTRLIKLGADVNTRGGEGQDTALTLAAKGDFLGLARALLEAGADQRIADGAGQTPQAIAQARNRSELMILLANPPKPKNKEEKK
ncbi:MAG TPA: ankyrin repeat domain-containing protein [Bdellovibrionota bacterium]|jgi:hypothetical protein|nr:ankyrin repeat domain-containing protein [Bdellovibrionota bacterium]